MRSQVNTYIFLILSCLPLLGQSTLYVKSNAVGLDTGTSWQDAFTNIHSAFQMAGDGDTIFVSFGTYLPTLDSDRSKSFQMSSGVCLIGGFSGNESSPNQRVLGQFPTIFSGNIILP
jgi:hypothetical protein